MRSVVMLGKWLLVVAGVLAFLIVVPLVEAARGLAGRARGRRGAGGPPARRSAPVVALPVPAYSLRAAAKS